jgi:hypothetical protein
MRSLAHRAGLDPAELTLTNDQIELLLGAAGDAAHDSGRRINAPLYCYLLGRATALSGADLSRLTAAPRPKPPEETQAAA